MMNHRPIMAFMTLGCLVFSSAQAQVAPNAEPNKSEIKIFSLAHVRAADAGTIVSDLFPSNSNYNGFGDGGGFVSGPLIDNSLRVAVDERTNSLIVSGHRETIEVVEAVLSRLDEDSKAPANVKKFVMFKLKNVPAPDAAAAVGVLGLEDTRIQADAVSNSLLVYGTAEAIALVKPVIETLDVSRPSPRPENFAIRVVWLVERPLAPNDAPHVPDDLHSPIAILSEKFQLSELRMAAQMTINATEAGTYSSTCTALIGEMCNFKFSGTLDEQAGRLELAVSAFVPGSEDSPWCELSTVITPRLGHPFILGTTTIHSSASVFVVELMETTSDDETE